MPASAVSPALRHTWTFFRAGGLDQVLIHNAADLLHLHELDPKLWIVFSCPVKGLEFDTRTLDLIDSDRDGRVRVPELLAAVKWACGLLKDPGLLLEPGAELPLAAINDATPEGALVLASAKQILVNLGKPTATGLTVTDAADVTKIFAETTFNGDGIVQAGCAKGPEAKTLIEEALKLYGADPDRSGKPGLSKAKLDTFKADLEAFDLWWKAGEDAVGAGVLPLGAGTAAAHGQYKAVQAKIDDWFTRCRLAAFDPRAAVALNRADADYQALAPKELALTSPEVAALPLARVQAGAWLSLTEGLNPAWAGAVVAFRAGIVMPLLGAGTTSLDEAAWLELKARFAPFETWIAGKKGAAVESLGIARVRAIRASGILDEVAALIAEDLAVAPQVSAIEAVERLARYHRDLGLLLKNFVNFADFYDRQPPPPIFMIGSLYLDQRSLDLCIRIDDPGAHSGLANLGKIFIVYAACTRPSGEKMTVACAVTQGDSDYLMVGRNGMFVDRKGRDWDATIVKILDHPISIGQAFWAPYKKIGKMISDTIERISGDADKAVMDKAGTQVATAATVPAKPPEKPKLDTGMLAAIGIAATSLAGAVGSIAGAVLGLPVWKMPLVFVGVVLAVSGPSMIIAFLKLRQRTLGPVLEANGWAINGRVKINIPLGNSLTAMKRLPANSRRILEDPFEDKAGKQRTRWTIILVILALLLAIGGFFAWQRYQGQVAQEAIATYRRLDLEASTAEKDKSDNAKKLRQDALTAKDQAKASADAAGIEFTP